MSYFAGHNKTAAPKFIFIYFAHIRPTVRSTNLSRAKKKFPFSTRPKGMLDVLRLFFTVFVIF
jgi:hypothetical protein